MDQSPSRSRTAIKGAVSVAAIGVAGFLILTSPWTWSLTHPRRDVAGPGPADLQNGRKLFLAADCATCHATPGQDNMLRLGGGRVLETAFGTFHMPNISPDPRDGIGGWSSEQFIRAVREGVGPDGAWPDGRNLYPSFPYTSYQRMTANDLRDMFAYIKTLEPVAGKAPEHELKFPFNLRRGVGIWRLAFLDGQPLPPAAPSPAAGADAVLARGRYLVEGPAHCAECHSPRTPLGNVQASLRYGGSPNPEGTGYVPNITPDETGIGFWSANAIADYLATGLSPIGKRAGGEMAEIVANTAQLPEADRHAMAVYLKTIPAVDRPGPGVPEPNRTGKVVMLPASFTSATRAAPLPTSDARAIAEAKDVYVADTSNLYLDAARLGTAGAEDGKVLGAARLAVLGRDGDRLQVRLAGWQVEGVDSVFYARQGQRIMQAVLGPAAIAKVARGASMQDPDTHQTWTRAELTFWIDGGKLNAQLPALWGYSARLFNTACAACHTLPSPQHYLANQWIGTLGAMKRFTSLSDGQYRLLLAYLQNHAKDTAAAAPAP